MLHSWDIVLFEPAGFWDHCGLTSSYSVEVTDADDEVEFGERDYHLQGKSQL